MAQHRRAMIDRDHSAAVFGASMYPAGRQPGLGVLPAGSAEDLELMALMDRQYLKTPFYGSRR